jgi:hypothetical protein
MMSVQLTMRTVPIDRLVESADDAIGNPDREDGIVPAIAEVVCEDK